MKTFSISFVASWVFAFASGAFGQFGSPEFAGGLDHALLGDGAYPLAPIHIDNGKVYEVVSGRMDRIVIVEPNGKKRVVSRPNLGLAKGQRFANGRAVVSSSSVRTSEARDWKGSVNGSSYRNAKSAFTTKVSLSLLPSERYEEVTMGILFFNNAGGAELFLKDIGSLVGLEERQVHLNLPFAYDGPPGSVQYGVLLFSPEGEIVTSVRQELTPLLNSMFESFYSELVYHYALASEGASKPVSLVQPFPIEGTGILSEVDQGEAVSFVLEVDRRGLVTAVEPQSTISDALALACERSLKEWLFLPGLEGGRPVSSRVRIPVTF